MGTTLPLLRRGGEWQVWLVDETESQETRVADDQEFGISRERVRQIEVRAFDKIQRAIRKQAIDERLIGDMA